MAISFIGSAEAQATNGSDVTLTLPTLLADDVVYVFGFNSSGAMITTGYTLVAGSGTRVFRKVMGATPDTTAVFDNTQLNNNGCAVVAICLRGVDTTTPEDATATIAGSSSTNPDPPSITTVTNGAWVLPFARSGVSDTTVVAPSGYSNQVDINSDGTSSDDTAGGATKEITTAGAEDPASWTTWASATWTAITVAVRPSTAVPFKNIDFPNPRGAIPSIVLRTWTDVLIPTLIGQDKLPGRNRDWPVPRGAVPSISLKTWLCSTVLLPDTKPFAQKDWPVPKGALASIALRTWLDPVKLNLIGQDRIYGDPGQVPTYPWDNPRGTVPSISLRTWLAQTIPLPDSSPFLNYDWPVPRGPVPSVALRTWIDQFKLLLQTTATPFAQTDWPNPRGAQPSIDLRTWTDPLKLNLQGQDQFFGLAGNPNFDWPVPRGPSRGPQDWINPALAATVSPFKQTDWQNPRGAQASIILRTWIDAVKLNLQGQDRFFGLAGNPTFDWPVPKGAQPVAHTWIGGFRLLDQAAQFPPPTNYDWPNPRGPAYAITLRTWLDPLKLNLQGKDQFFGLAGNPNFDWPNPRGPQYPVALRTWIDQTVPLPDSSPFRQNDWANPRRAASPVDLLTWVQTGFTPEAAPFFNYDWPNPQAVIRSSGLRTWINQFNILLQQQAVPFANFDWPNPRTASPSIVLRTWVIGFGIQYQAAAFPPPTNYDWPNPRASARSIALRTWITQVNLMLNPVTPFTTTRRPLFRRGANTYWKGRSN